MIATNLFGPSFPAILTFALFFYAIPLWAIIDASMKPSRVFVAAGSSRAMWISLMAVFVLFVAPIAAIISIVYLLKIRPKVNKAFDEEKAEDS